MYKRSTCSNIQNNCHCKILHNIHGAEKEGVGERVKRKYKGVGPAGYVSTKRSGLEGVEEQAEGVAEEFRSGIASTETLVHALPIGKYKRYTKVGSGCSTRAMPPLHPDTFHYSGGRRGSDWRPSGPASPTLIQPTHVGGGGGGGGVTREWRYRRGNATQRG